MCILAALIIFVVEGLFNQMAMSLVRHVDQDVDQVLSGFVSKMCSQVLVEAVQMWNAKLLATSNVAAATESLLSILL